MVTEYKKEEKEIILWCHWYDSDAYIGCKLKENDYYEYFKGMTVKVMLESRHGGHKLYAEGNDVKNIGKIGKFRLMRGGHGEGYYEQYIGLRDHDWTIEDRYKRNWHEMLDILSEPPQVLDYGNISLEQAKEKGLA